MKIQARSNVREIERGLDKVGRQQFPFAMSKALNATADQFQERQRAGMQKRFTLRRKPWVDRSVKRGKGDFATKKKLEAIVRIETPGDKGRSDVLTQHEDGGTKRPRSGRTLSVPADVRRGKTGVIPKNLRPGALNLRPWGESGTVMRGDRRTVLIRTGNDRGVILQRTGRGKRAKLKVLYRLKGSVPLKPGLEFFKTAKIVVNDRLVENVRRELDRAISTARVR